MADNEEIFTTSFQAGRKRIYVDVKENHAGTYLKIKERGDSQSNSILIPSGSIVELRNALDEAVQALGALDSEVDTDEGGGAAGAPPRDGPRGQGGHAKEDPAPRRRQGRGSA